MKYEKLVHAYYSTFNSNNNLRPLNREKKEVLFAKFYANDLQTKGDYITFNSMNAWGQITPSRFHISNVVKIEDIKEVK